MLSRRLFLAATPALALRARKAHGHASSDVAIWDLQGDCGLPESLRGFQRALPGAPTVQSFPAEAGVVLIPGALTLRPAAVHRLQTFAAAGGVVLLESALAFGDASVFARQQAMFAKEFGIEIERPIDLWSRRGTAGLPYIEYHRPVQVLVRDFTLAIPTRTPGSYQLATVQGATVAARYRFGYGEINFLGSPLGPVLLSGDREAAQWLAAFLRRGTIRLTPHF